MKTTIISIIIGLGLRLITQTQAPLPSNQTAELSKERTVPAVQRIESISSSQKNKI
ncbi:MAG TPA: hypothetical protein VK808_14055 [Bacteroidia bacterium]|jgi:hypothetical protein|nr:hypothetical protein [Bacteroidia bacterium]